MKQLPQTINSREVAKQTGKRHGDLVRDIEVYIEYIDQNADLRSDDFFIESSYKAGTGKPYKCYECTKQGCEMIGNKMTGKKGIQFTAFYVQQFNSMENHIKNEFVVPTTFAEALRLAADVTEENETLKIENKVSEQIISELKPKADYYDSILKNKNLVTITIIAKNYGMSGTEMNKLLHDLKVQYKQGNTWLMYSKYQNKGYTHTEMIPVKGTEKPQPSTKWTQKGHIFIYQLLKEHGILPMIERGTK